MSSLQQQVVLDRLCLPSCRYCCQFASRTERTCATSTHTYFSVFHYTVHLVIATKTSPAQYSIELLLCKSSAWGWRADILTLFTCLREAIKNHAVRPRASLLHSNVILSSLMEEKHVRILDVSPDTCVHQATSGNRDKHMNMGWNDYRKILPP